MSEAIDNRIAMLRAERGISRRNLADAPGVHDQAGRLPAARPAYLYGLSLCRKGSLMPRTRSVNGSNAVSFAR
jgi:hypothetical protein